MPYSEPVEKMLDDEVMKRLVSSIDRGQFTVEQLNTVITLYTGMKETERELASTVQSLSTVSPVGCFGTYMSDHS